MTTGVIVQGEANARLGTLGGGPHGAQGLYGNPQKKIHERKSGGGESHRVNRNAKRQGKGKTEIPGVDRSAKKRKSKKAMKHGYVARHR